jgi:peptide-methionine (S)-S-oxide reductase
MDHKMARAVETATLGGGCFWCLEAIFKDIKGVERVVSGFSGGTVANPSYREVCAGATGHAEVVQVTFDPGIITYREILEVFFAIHDPTTRDRQGPDTGHQYRSIILAHDAAQGKTAEAVIRELEAAHAWGAPIVTEVVPFEAFYPAEDYHQGYFEANPGQPYCRAVVGPKVAKFRKTHAEKLKGRSPK